MFAAAGLGLWAALALGPDNAVATQTGSAHADPRLFEAVFRSISSHYLDPVTAEALAVAGLAQLGTVDSSLAVERDGAEIRLRQYRDIVLEEAAPAAGDNQGWGDVTAVILDAARQRSAAVTALSEDKLDETVIDGSIRILDRFTRYAPPTIASERRDSRDGYGGIGVTVDIEGPSVRIAMVMPDTPAAAAGIASGDRITAVDGIDATAISHEDLIHRLRGPIGSSVRLALARDGKVEPLNIMLKRAQIVIRTVTLKHEEHVATIRVTSFNARTADNVAEALDQAHREMGNNLRGIVLDLRGDPGGLLDQSILVASLFLDSGIVVSTQGRVADSRQVFEVDRRVPAERLPLVVLINGGSASASEIVAAALQDDGRAVLVGTASFGKGTVQNVVHLPNQGELTVTWARLLPPAGYILHEHGVVPAICTANLKEATQATARPGPDRSSLDAAGWTALRNTCPPDRLERDLDMQVATRLLNDPVLYSEALAVHPLSTSKPVRSASVATTYR